VTEQKRTIAVLFGGQSGEHEVSLTSAYAVMSALDRVRYEVLPVGIGKDGRWIAGGSALAQLVQAADPQQLPTGVDWDTVASDVQTLAADAASPASVPPDPHSWHPAALFTRLGVDVIFPVLHGPMGEDGTVQGLLELAALPYVGCGVAASAVSMDKALMKAAFAAAGLPLLPWTLVRRGDWQRSPQAIYHQLEDQFSYPLFIKPANMGSSVGVSKATDQASLEAGLAEAARYDRRIVVEQGINAREIEVSVLGNDAPVASMPGEVIPSGEWYDYQAKYLSGQSQIIIPADVPTELREQVQQLATRAFLAVDGAGLARVDFLLDRSSSALWLNEVNTMPGFTAVSMYAKMWEASGLAYGALLDRLIELALERFAERHTTAGQGE
jgi:D-alanine-D-alanine ligase